MGFLTDAARKKDRSTPDKDLEEEYERLFAKIGRDFVHKKDFENILLQLLSLLEQSGLVNKLAEIDFSDDSEARKRALEYKQFLDDQKNGSLIYQDLINLDD